MNATVLAEMQEFAASLGVTDLPDVATGAVSDPAPVADRGCAS